MTQQHKINQALELVRAHKVPMLSGHDLLSVASQRKQELMQILAQCHLSPDMYPLIPGHAMQIVEGIGDYTFTSPYDFDGSFSSHKQMRKMLKEELESSLNSEKMANKIELSALGITGIPNEVYNRQLKQLLRIIMRGSLQTLLCQTLLQSLFVVVNTHGGSTAINAQLVQESFNEQTQQLLSDFSLLSVELFKYTKDVSRNELHYVTDQQIQISMDALLTMLSPYLDRSVRETLYKIRRAGKSQNLLTPAAFLHTLILSDNSPSRQAQRKHTVINDMEQKLDFMPIQLMETEVDHRTVSYSLAQGTEYTKDNKSKWEWLVRILPLQCHEGVKLIKQQQLLQNGFLPEWSAIWKILAESLSEQSHQTQPLTVNAVNTSQEFKPARYRQSTPGLEVTGTTVSEWEVRGNRFARRYGDDDRDHRGRPRPFDDRRGRDTNPNRGRSRSNDRGDDHSRDRERKRQQFEEDQAKRTLSKSPKRQLDQGDDSKRREQSRSRSREPRPPSSEDKEKEPRERSQSPTEQMQFATNNFEMLLTKQKQALEQMNQERDAKHRRK
jgi:hypothetical protein